MSKESSINFQDAINLVNLPKSIAIDLSILSVNDTIKLIGALIVSRFTTTQAIYAYLNERGCPYNEEIIDHLIDLYLNGSSYAQLWEIDDYGDLMLRSGVNLLDLDS